VELAVSDIERKPKDTSSGGNDTAYLILLGGLMMVALLVPMLVATLLFKVCRRLHLRRLEYSILGLAGLALIWLNGADFAGDYLAWFASFLPGRDTDLVPPLLASFSFALPLAALFGLIAGTALGAKVPGGLFGRKASVLEREAIIPPKEQRERISVSQPGGLLVAASEHSPVEQSSEVGKRFIPLGIDAHGQPVGVNEHELGMHAMILGSTGSGKTVTIQTLAAGLMDLGWHGLVLDLKEAGDLEDWFSEYATTHAIPYQSLMLSDEKPEYWLNPLYGMKADSALDALMMFQRYGDNAAYYEALNKRMAAQALNLLYDAHAVDPTQYEFPDIYALGRTILSAAATKKDPAKDALQKKTADVIRLMPGLRSTEDYEALLSPDPKEAETASGLGTRLTNMLETANGRLILKPSGGRLPLDVTMDGLTYVGLDTQGRPEMSQVIASFLLQRIAVYAAERTIHKERGISQRPRFLIIDEANQVSARGVILTLLQKARAAGICVILATQSPTDWIDRDGNDWGAMSTNTNVAMIHSQGGDEAGEMCASYLGKERRMVAGFQYADGEVLDAGNLREVEDYRVTADELRQLSIGEMVLRVGKPDNRIAYLRVAMRDPSAHARTRPIMPQHPALPLLGDAPRASGPALPPVLGGGDDDPIGGRMPTPT
jgi:hypothetical protein